MEGVILPASVRDFMEASAAEVPFGELQKAVQQLSEHYRAGKGTAQLKISAKAKTAAYLLTRLPATYAAAHAVLEEVRRRLGDWQPATVLDLGAGMGAATLAARQVFDARFTAVLVEQEAVPPGLFRDFDEARWVNQDLRQWAPEGPVDLTLVSYALGELAPEARSRVVAKAWERTQTLVLLEPGSPRGFEVIRDARRQLIGLGGNLVAPCPSAGECPIAAGDWCHFGQRLERSALHRRLKDASLSYEDEKFSYVVATRLPAVERAAGRVIRRPVDAPGLITLEVCQGEAVVTERVTKRDKERFRAAHKVRWGEEWK